MSSCEVTPGDNGVVDTESSKPLEDVGTEVSSCRLTPGTPGGSGVGGAASSSDPISKGGGTGRDGGSGRLTAHGEDLPGEVLWSCSDTGGLSRGGIPTRYQFIISFGHCIIF